MLLDHTGIHPEISNMKRVGKPLNTRRFKNTQDQRGLERNEKLF